VFHIELRQFPHVARTFNLSREELDARILAPWAAGRAIELQGHEYTPGKAKLTIYEAAELAPGEMGLGRSWPNVTRRGEDVTAKVLKSARPSGATRTADPLKDELAVLAGAAPVGLQSIIALATHRYPGARVSERLALAENIAWELLHEGRVALVNDGEIVPQDEWQAVLLEWSTWAEPGVALEGPD
jgi:hypothetical protein